MKRIILRVTKIKEHGLDLGYFVRNIRPGFRKNWGKKNNRGRRRIRGRTSWHAFCTVAPGLAHTNSTFSPQSEFMCFVWISEQTAIISLYSINWLVFITVTECVYSAVRTGSLYTILHSALTVYLCVLCGSQNKQRLFPYTALTDWFL